MEKGREKERQGEREKPIPRPYPCYSLTWWEHRSSGCSSSSIQHGSLSVICNKCLHHIFRELEIITGWGAARLLIGSIGPYQLRIFPHLWQIPILKSLSGCQFNRLLKELILILIGTFSSTSWSTVRNIKKLTWTLGVCMHVWDRKVKVLRN